MKAYTYKTSLLASNEIQRKKVSKGNLALYLTFIFTFEPKIFVKINIVNYIYIFGIVCVFLINVYQYIVLHKKLSALMILLVLYRLSFGIQTIINNGDIAVWGYISLVLISLEMTIEIHSNKSFKTLLNCIVNVLTGILLVNIIMLFIFPQGIIDGIVFIGIRTRFTEVMLVDVVLAVTYDKLFGKKLSSRSYIVFILSAITIFKAWIATAILGFAFLLVVAIIFRKRDMPTYIFPFMLLVLLLLDILIVHFRILDCFDWLLVDVLHKSTSLSGRTEIWDNAFQIIFKKPVFGYGLADNGNFVPWVWGGIGEIELWQAHNQWLQLMYDGGVVCVVLFIALTVLSYNKLKKNKEVLNKSKYLIIGMLAFYLMMIVEIFSYTPYFFVLPFIMYNLQNYDIKLSGKLK